MFHYMPCLNCSKEMKTKDSERKYCCFKCKAEYEKIVRSCKRCNVEFNPSSDTNIYCSTSCAKAASHEMASQNYEVSRFVILKRDDFTCVYCGRSPIDAKTELHVDHVYPRDKGGKNDPFNLVTACVRCNLEKSNHPLSDEVTMRLWERNQRLNEKNGISNYDQLKATFDLIYKQGNGGPKSRV